MKRFVLGAVFLIASLASAQLVPVSPQLEMLKQFDGTWKGKLAMMGMEMDATIVTTSPVHSYYQHTKMLLEIPGVGQMEESMYLSYDEKAGEYVGYAFSDASATPRIERGNFRRGRLVTITDPWDNGQGPAVYRSQMWLEEGKVHFILEQQEGEEWTELTHAVFTKASD